MADRNMRDLVCVMEVHVTQELAMQLQSNQAADLVLNLINTPGPVSDALKRAQSEGRQLTREELKTAFDQDTGASEQLSNAVSRLKQ